MNLLKAVAGRVAWRRLKPITRSVVRDNLTYLSVDKLQRIEGAIERTRSVPGAIVEFGVALGGSAIIFAKLKDAGRAFVGFDVFAMIPPPTSDHDDQHARQRYEVIKSGASSGIGGEQYYGYRADLIGDVRRAFDRHGVPVDGRAVRLVQGLFEDSWPTAGVEGVSLAHIDCDWYDPVKFCLQAIADKMAPGGIIILDDYYDYGGCRAAVDEFRGCRDDFDFADGPNPFLIRRA